MGITTEFHGGQRFKEQFRRWLPDLAIVLAMVLTSALAAAATFDVPDDGSTVVGIPRIVIPTRANTLLDIARKLDVGYHEITWANPGVDVWMPDNAERVVVPSQFILPPKPWTGVVLNISQRRLFYFPAVAKGQPVQVITFPVSIAREGWSTPLGATRVVAKHKDPSWFVPKSIQAEHKAASGEEFPEYFPPGPDNPKGMLAIQLGLPGIFIHGTNKPWGVGMRTSHGCFHLYPEDAAELFPLMKAGIPVRIIDEPVVAGISGGQLHLASYEPVVEYGTTGDLMTRAVLALAPFLQPSVQPSTQTTPAPQHFSVDWEKVKTNAATHQVVPVSVAPEGISLAQKLSTIQPEIYEYSPYGVDANNAAMPEEPVIE